VLNISFEATSQLQMGNEWIEFHARFSGKSHKIEVPVANVLAIYARENGQGMAFPVESAGGEATDSADDDEAVIDEAPQEAPQAAEKASETDEDPRPDDDGTKGGGRGHLKVVK
jgi:stringent starvation protein B